jgi:lipid-A-disaccharide synthase
VSRRFASGNPKQVLVVAGEPSGDLIAGGVARVLAARGWRSFGIGGAACSGAGMRIVADIGASAAMGLTEVVTRLPSLVLMHARLTRAARDERPAAAVLVNYSEYNQHLGRQLRRLGIPVLRCGAPQVWAWRRGRIAELAHSLDRLAVILPFEEALFRDAGIEARYVGHPVLDVAARSRTQARALLGLGSHDAAVALLPGSRAHEVRRLAPALLQTVVELEKIGRSVEARVAVAPSLEPATAIWLRGLARSAQVGTIEVSPELGASEWLSAFDAALIASGTATLESALAAVPPVIVYRLSPLTAAVARRVVRTPFIGLPNIVLGAKHYPELLQEEATPPRIAREVARVLDTRKEFEPLASSLRRLLTTVLAQPATCAERIAAMMHDWLGLPRDEPSIDADCRRAAPA